MAEDMEEWTMIDVAAQFKSLLKIVECSVCLDTVQPDMIQCVKGHVICSKCRGTWARCPTCLQPFSNVEQPSALAQLVAAIPHQCKHTNCTTLVRPGSDHEGYCGWRQTHCRLRKCRWSGPAREIVDHLRDEHSYLKPPVPPGPTYTEISLPPITIPDFNPAKGCSFTHYLYLHDQFFWELLTNDIDKDIFTIQYIYVSNGKPKLKREIFLTVTFSSKNTKHLTKIKLNLDPEVAGTNKNVILVPRHMLADFIDKEGYLNYEKDVLIK